MNLRYVRPDTVCWFYKKKAGDRSRGHFSSKEEAVAAALEDRDIVQCKKFIVEARRPEPFDFNDICKIEEILCNHAMAENPSDDSYPDMVNPYIHETVNWDNNDGNFVDEELLGFFKNLVDNHGLWAWGGDWQPVHERYEIPVVKSVEEKETVVKREEVSFAAGEARKMRIKKG